MIKIFLPFLVAGFLNITSAYACGNEYYTTIGIPMEKGKLKLEYLLNSPQKTYLPYWSNGFYGPEVPFLIQQQWKDSLRLHAKSGKNSSIDKDIATLIEMDAYQILSDYAWHEVRIGHKEKAIALLEKLYQKHPKEYNIVANLGTAYEVVGKNTRALELLRKAVDINPASHFNSEWIHIKILEQKTSSDPDYTKIISLGTDDFPKWIANHDYKFSQDPDSLKKAIAYQLHERISFVLPPDPIVAQLVLDFADIVAKHDGFKDAMPFYDFAGSYNKPQFDKVVAERKTLLTNTTTEIKTSFRWASLVWGLPLVVFGLIFIAWIRSRRKQSVGD